jgi:ABC-type lipoprotein export system ATPase subunit
MDENELTRLRRERVGFVFQAFNLMPSLTVAQNITLPLSLAVTMTCTILLTKEASSTQLGAQLVTAVPSRAFVVETLPPIRQGDG